MLPPAASPCAQPEIHPESRSNLKASHFTIFHHGMYSTMPGCPWMLDWLKSGCSKNGRLY